MFRREKRTLCALLILLFAVALPGTEARAASGECGLVSGTMIWSLSDSGVMTIRGSGSMKSWATETQVAWRALRNSIRAVVVESGVTSIGSNAFTGCPNLISVSLPPTIVSIGSYAFSNCAALDDLRWEEGLRTIGDNAFAGCTSLTELTVPHSVIEVGRYAFARCTYLRTITIPGSVTLLDAGTFQGCTRLTEVYLPDSVSEVGQRAFSGCTALTHLILPGSLTTVRDYAIENCTAIGEIDFKGTEAAWQNLNYDFNRANVTRPLSQFLRQIQEQGIEVVCNWTGEDDDPDSSGGEGDGGKEEPAARIASLTVGHGRVTVELSQQADTGSRIYAAAYDGDGRFLGILSSPAGSALSHTLYLDTEGAVSVTAFLTDADGRPAADPVSQKVP